LLATSLLGTGYGGNYRKTGDMVKRLLPLLYSLADELKVDIAIVTIEEEVFALTNSVKKQFLDFQCPDSPLYRTINGSRYLNDATLDKLRFLAAQAMCGELTLFVGAGASMGVGIPSWANLLNTIACKLGIEGEDFKEFSSLDYYTKAAVLESRLKKRNAALDAEGGNQAMSYRMCQVLLLLIPQIITTNYDDLLEKAWSYSGCFWIFYSKHSVVYTVHTVLFIGQFSVLPWLLKMHGTITHPDEIVLSKRDYMRYHDRFAAMAGIVQSTLLTRHLLFVGFSLDDDNFQRIFDSVRKA
ncbi:unnamed protein product, partial [Ectocarpus fasciculatus]